MRYHLLAVIFGHSAWTDACSDSSSSSSSSRRSEESVSIAAAAAAERGGYYLHLESKKAFWPALLPLSLSFHSLAHRPFVSSQMDAPGGVFIYVFSSLSLSLSLQPTFPAGNENGGKVAVQDSAKARHDVDAKAERLEDFTPKLLAVLAVTAPRQQRQGALGLVGSATAAVTSLAGASASHRATAGGAAKGGSKRRRTVGRSPTCLPA